MTESRYYTLTEADVEGAETGAYNCPVYRCILRTHQKLNVEGQGLRVGYDHSLMSRQVPDSRPAFSGTPIHAYLRASMPPEVTQWIRHFESMVARHDWAKQHLIGFTLEWVESP